MKKFLGLSALLVGATVFLSGCGNSNEEKQPTETDNGNRNLGVPGENINQRSYSVPIDIGEEGTMQANVDTGQTGTANSNKNINGDGNNNSNKNANQNSNKNKAMQNNTSGGTSTAPNESEIKEYSKYTSATIKTDLGDIKVKFYGADSPKTVANFVKLAKNKFYDGVSFHRVIKDFMIQTGDPNSKDDDWSNDGMGGPGYKFEDEFNSHKLVKGSLAMANSGPSTNGSQFFIVTADATAWLDGKHTNFGEVISGLDIVQKIEAAQVNQNDHPMKDIRIKTIEVR